jgi:hypothetical protein
MQHKIHKARHVLCIIVRRWGAEIRMLEGVTHPYSVRGVKSEQFAHEVEERPVVVVDWDNDLLCVRIGTEISTHARTIPIRTQRTSSALVARTSFLLCLVALAEGQSSLFCSLKYSAFCAAPLRAKRSGMLPMTISIMAKCSRLSCVW